MVQACPECDSSSLDVAPGGYGLPRTDHDERWRCSDCGARFGEPVDRESRHPAGSTRSGLAKRLADADPDEVSG